MDKTDFSLISQIITDKSGVIISFHNDETKWCADPKKNIIFCPDKPYYSNSDLGIAIHEAGHIRFSWLPYEIEKEIGESDNKKALWDLTNTLEDLRIENKMREVYAGASAYLKLYTKEVFDDIIAKGLVSTESQDDNLARHYCLYFLYKYGIGQGFADEYLSAWKLGENTKLMKAIENSEVAFSKVYDLRDTSAVFDLVKNDLLCHYIPLLPKNYESDLNIEELVKQFIKELTELKEIAESKGKAQRGAGTNKDTNKSVGKSDDDNDKTFAIGGGIGECTDDDNADDMKSGKQMFDVGHKAIEGIGREVTGNTKIDLNKDNSPLSQEIKNFVSINTPKIKKAISIIKDKDITRMTGNSVKGKLVSKNLYKIRTGNFKVFAKKDTLADSEKNVAFGLLIDESGSMFGYDDDNGKTKIDNAILSASLFGEGLKKAGKKFAVWGFQGNFYTHKGFNDKPLTSEQYADIKNFARTNREYGGASYNSDGYAIHRAVEEFNKLPKYYKKVLVVFSDGLPAPHKDFNSYSLEKEVLKAEKELNIFSIGICDDSVQGYYSNYTVINNANELPNQIIDIFKKIAGKRKR